MTPPRLCRSLLAAVLICLLFGEGAAAAPNPPGGSEPPSDRDPCENYGKYPSLNADHDRDGLSGYQECQLGTNPTDPDTDGDELWDAEEPQIGTNPTVADTDADLLDDCYEYHRALDGWPTDPLLAGPDSDGDLIADALEVYKGLNPGNIDSDQDLLFDTEEVLPLRCSMGKGSPWFNAVEPDIDGDGLDDGVEAKSLGTNRWLFDTDGDGYGDGDEVLKWGTDPLDPNDPSASNPPDYHP